jgi:hypothetical protein
MRMLFEKKKKKKRKDRKENKKWLFFTRLCGQKMRFFKGFSYI